MSSPKQGKWSPLEENILRRHMQNGLKPKEIAEIIEGRSASACSQHWGIMRKQMEEAEKEYRAKQADRAASASASAISELSKLEKSGSHEAAEAESENDEQSAEEDGKDSKTPESENEEQGSKEDGKDSEAKACKAAKMTHPWTTAEIEMLVQLAGQEMPMKKVASFFTNPTRSAGACHSMYHRLKHKMPASKSATEDPETPGSAKTRASVKSPTSPELLERDAVVPKKRSSSEVSSDAEKARKKEAKKAAKRLKRARHDRQRDPLQAPMIDAPESPQGSSGLENNAISEDRRATHLHQRESLTEEREGGASRMLSTTIETPELSAQTISFLNELCAHSRIGDFVDLEPDEEEKEQRRMICELQEQIREGRKNANRAKLRELRNILDEQLADQLAESAE